ncbi:LmeA family phospholipid-binding protein [Streptomyces sp. P6-2-1]|uniref:LmeA family phospholipid-binding protein n=1 Tax=Streptomyces sp. P6-2-1 TaxID=3422591 RepID=UPI003D36782B
MSAIRRVLYGWRKYALAVVALAGVGTGADRGLARWPEKSAAEAFQEAQDLPTTPEVHVRGFPVLTQAAGGSLDRVDVTADDVPGRGARPVPVTRLDVRLDHVRRAGEAGAAHADTARATAYLSCADLSSALGIDIRSAGDGRVTAGTAPPLLGEATASARLAVSGTRGIVFRDVEVDARPPARLRTAVAGALGRGITLEGVPGNLRLIRLTTGEDGIRADLAGENVTFRTDEERA